MDINNFFGKPEQQDVKQKTRTMSLVSYLNTKPLVYGLENNLVEHHFSLQKDVPSVCAQRLLEGEVELGIVPSIEYARAKGSWKIIPDLSIASQRAVKSVCLFFNKNMSKIDTIALDTSSRTSVALLKIILQERYEQTPEFIFMAPDLDEMLAAADAALIIGDKALHYSVKHTNFIDLGEEWSDMTGLPFVYAFWAGNELQLNEKDVKAVLESYQEGSQNIEKIAREFGKTQPMTWDFYYDYLTQNISYSFAEEEKAGLLEFYRYAFYFGLIEHIPDLHFYGE